MITPILIYFLKVNLALAFLYICYRLLFRDDTFFRLRRGVLLSIYLIAFLYPLPDLSGWLSTQTSVAGIVGYYSGLLPKETVLTASNEIAASDWKETGLKVMQVIWLAGAGLLLSRCLAELFTVSRLHRKCRKITLNGIEVCILPEAEASYSFFGWIFISSDPHQRERLDDILIHEQTHVRQWHSIDMMAGEIICIACWLNPFAWWLKKEIGINHEFIADEQVMLAGFDKKEYQYHLNNIDAMARVLNEKVAEVIQQPTALATTTVSKMEAANPLPPEKDKIYDTCDIMPEFPGGQNALLQFLAKNIKYPTEAQQQGKQGKVVVTFVIEKDGSITNAKVTQALYPSLDEESLRIVKSMPKWTPGKMKDGKVVRVQYTVPLTYRLQ